MSEEKEGWDKIPKLEINKRALKKKLKKAQGKTTKHAHKFIIKRLGSIRDSQQYIAKWIFMMGLLIAATGFQIVWHQANYQVESLATEGVYAEALLGPVNNLNPIFASSSAEQSAGRLLFSRLLFYDKTGNLNYDLVRSITKDDDSALIVKIKSNVFWHDGNRLTADDIVFTVDLIKNPNLNTSIVGLSNISVEKIDDLTFKILAKSNFATFQHLLTFPILPKHLLSDIPATNIREAKFGSSPVGSGPFKLKYIQDVDLSSGRKVIYLNRNENYYNGSARIDRFQLHVYNDIESIKKALALNEVNATADLPPSEIGQINPKRYDVLAKPIQGGVYAILNTTSDILQDVNIRRALQLTVNHQALKESIGLDLPSLNLPLTSYHLPKDRPDISPYNLGEARSILDNNGWLVGANNLRLKDGQELKLSVVVLKDPELEKVLDIIVKQWRELGIKIDTRVIDPSDISQDAVRTVLQPRAYDILIRRLFIGADPDVYAYWHSSQTKEDGLNFANYSNQISDDALITARMRSELDLRNAKYLTFVKQWLADVPAIGLYQSSLQYVKAKGVSAFAEDNVLISALDRYNDVIDWSSGDKSVLKTP